MKHKAIIFFTRVPKPGEVKTRLHSILTQSQCCELQSAFIADVYGAIELTGYEIIICYTPDGEEDEFHKILEPYARRPRFLLQRGETLGQRMYHAIYDVLEQEYDSCLLLGSDIPLITASDMEAGFTHLQNNDITISPTEDGGYCVIGMKKAYAGLFQIEYGGEDVCAETIRKIKSMGLRVAVGKTQLDIDDEKDLRKLRGNLLQNPDLPCPKTRQVLTIFSAKEGKP